VSGTPAGPQPPPALIAEATRRAGHVWIVIDGQDRPRPAWHIWRAGPGPAGPEPPGAAYVLTGPGEQPLPGLAGAGRVTVIAAGSRAPGARGGLVTWTAAVSRVEPGSGEWDEVIGQLVAGRLNAVLAEGETSPARRWARSGAVFRLSPVLGDTVPADTAAPNSRTLLSAAGRQFVLRQPGRHAGRHVQLESPQLHALPAGPGHRRTDPLSEPGHVA
jgi:hypothetical protein